MAGGIFKWPVADGQLNRRHIRTVSDSEWVTMSLPLRVPITNLCDRSIARQTPVFDPVRLINLVT